MERDSTPQMSSSGSSGAGSGRLLRGSALTPHIHAGQVVAAD